MAGQGEKYLGQMIALLGTLNRQAPKDKPELDALLDNLGTKLMELEPYTDGGTWNPEVDLEHLEVMQGEHHKAYGVGIRKNDALFTPGFKSTLLKIFNLVRSGIALAPDQGDEILEEISAICVEIANI